ncbi:MAG: alcohol dehydrogenase catalytic domain-containing protein [Actinobacteria bacterium]|nr:alcohol dehydrogenase catalytic domain-containing protein [Actinomycetota bacterium]
MPPRGSGRRSARSRRRAQRTRRAARTRAARRDSASRGPRAGRDPVPIFTSSRGSRRTRSPTCGFPTRSVTKNSGWVEEVGSSVTTVKPGDPVIVYPKRSCSVCLACRRGEDMYCHTCPFPRLDSEGGFAEYLSTSERTLVKLEESLEPKDVAALADAGITPCRAARKAAASLPPAQMRSHRGRRPRAHRHPGPERWARPRSSRPTSRRRRESSPSRRGRIT